MTKQSEAEVYICLSLRYSYRLSILGTICHGYERVAEGGPEQNLALHLVLFTSGKARTERAEERSVTLDSGLQGRGSLDKELKVKVDIQDHFSLTPNCKWNEPH